MKRLFRIYAAVIVVVQPILWCWGVGASHRFCNMILLMVGSSHPFDTPIRQFSFWMATVSPVIIWPVAAAFFGVDMFQWRFFSKE